MCLCRAPCCVPGWVLSTSSTSSSLSPRSPSLTLSLSLSPSPQAYFRQGVALQYLGRHADALAAFASGLAQDPKSLQLLVGMVEAAMKSPLRGTVSG